MQSRKTYFLAWRNMVLTIATFSKVCHVTPVCCMDTPSKVLFGTKSPQEGSDSTGCRSKLEIWWPWSNSNNKNKKNKRFLTKTTKLEWLPTRHSANTPFMTWCPQWLAQQPTSVNNGSFISTFWRNLTSWDCLLRILVRDCLKVWCCQEATEKSWRSQRVCNGRWSTTAARRNSCKMVFTTCLERENRPKETYSQSDCNLISERVHMPRCWWGKCSNCHHLLMFNTNWTRCLMEIKRWSKRKSRVGRRKHRDNFLTDHHI